MWRADFRDCGIGEEGGNGGGGGLREEFKKRQRVSARRGGGVCGDGGCWEEEEEGVMEWGVQGRGRGLGLWVGECGDEREEA